MLYTNAAGEEEKEMVVLDMVMRNRVWRECVVYCASSRRSAESIFAMLCAQLGVDRRNEVLLDWGEGNFRGGRNDASGDVRVVITSPAVLKCQLCKSNPTNWMNSATVVFIDGFSAGALDQWEEILLSMPSRVLLCLFMKQPSEMDKELLPLWLESIQNSVVAISPTGATSLEDRMQSPQIFPLLRTFAFNAAIHEAPVQVSLTLVKEMLAKEREDVEGEFVPRFAECFLHGSKPFETEETSELVFNSAEEAEYADVAALIVADAKRTAAKTSQRSKKRGRGRKGRWTAAAKAAARKRREAALRDSALMPAVVLLNGKKETEYAAMAVRSALDENGVIWDEDSRAILHEIVKKYEREIGEEMSELDHTILEMSRVGIGIVHDGCAPGIRLFVEELFRGQMISVLFVDTHLGSGELLSLPGAKSVLIDSSAVALCDDEKKGLIKMGTVVSLAGRMGKDDVGNLIVLWYDEEIDDESAGSEIASTLLYPIFSTPIKSEAEIKSSPLDMPDDGDTAVIPDLVKQQFQPRSQSSAFLSSYDGILRSVRRFGMIGTEGILDYTLRTYTGWLQRASLHATIEKMNAEKRAIDEKLETFDAASIADHERRLAKKNEASRVFSAMQEKMAYVQTERMKEILLASPSGLIIGVTNAESRDETSGWEATLPFSKEQSSSQRESGGTSGSDETGLVSSRRNSLGQSDRKEHVSAAVFVAIRDQGSGEKRTTSMEDRWLVVCILADGMWTMLPVSDVVGLGREADDVVSNVEALQIPHAATFDIDPSTQWAKSFPVDNLEKNAVHTISDELIKRVTSDDERPVIEQFEIPAFEVQRARLKRLEDSYRESAWYGREDELLQRRHLRRRTAELGDDISSLQERERELEESMFRSNKHEVNCQSAVYAVLEDCHAVSILGDRDMEMTPIGALASVIPGQFPLFTSACLTLIDDIANLRACQFAAFVALVSCGEPPLQFDELFHHQTTEGDRKLARGIFDEEGEDELDLSMLASDHQEDSEGMGSRALMDVDSTDMDQIKLAGVLPESIVKMVKDILVALQQLHRRHNSDVGRENEDWSLKEELVPQMLNIHMAKAVYDFSNGKPWKDVVNKLNGEAGYVTRELRHVRGVLEIVLNAEEEGEFADGVQDIALQALATMDRWPVRDGDVILELVDMGIVEKKWSGNTYEKWWRSLKEMIGDTKEDGNEGVKRADAEVV